MAKPHVSSEHKNSDPVQNPQLPYKPSREASAVTSVESLPKIVLRETGTIILYLIFWAGMFYPAIFKFKEGFLGGIRSDPAAYVFYSMHNIQRVITWPSAWLDASYFYPFGKTLAYSDNFILPALLAKPIYLLTASYELAYNCTMLLASLLNAYMTFCLARLVTKNYLAAFLAGFSFMCLPFLFGHLGHPQLQFAFFVPAVAIASLMFARKRTFFWASAIGFCIFFVFFSTAYYSMIAYLVSALILICYAALRFRTLRVRDFGVLTLANIPWVIGLYFASAPYKVVRDTFGNFHPSLVKRFAAGFGSYIAASPKHYAWGHLAGDFARNGSYLSIGLVMLVLGLSTAVMLVFFNRVPEEIDKSFRKQKLFLAALSGIAVLSLTFSHLFFYEQLSNNDTLRAYLTAMPLWAILLSSFALLVLRGINSLDSEHKELGQLDYGYIALFIAVFFFFASFGIIGYHGSTLPHPGLYYKLYQFLPGYNSMRAVYRFGIVCNLFLAILAAISFTALLKSKRLQNTGLKIFFVLLTFGVVGFEHKIIPYNTSDSGPRPEVYQQLDKIPGDEALVSLPFLNVLKDGHIYSRYQTAYMLWSLPTGRPMMSGWSSKLPRYYQFAGPSIDKFPKQPGLNKLGQVVGVKYVVFNRAHVREFNREEFFK
ncbi:hypothetical protein BVY02_00805 [bacterium J17]|nr:hypothetical protein BVY02_00805 [bacterium J17]